MRTGVHVNAIPCWPNLQHAALVKSRWLNSSKNIPTSLRSISINNRNTGRKRHSIEQLDGPLDDHLSKRPLAFDPQGYFIISIDRHECRIIAEHYGNTINDQGLACDEETGEVIGCKGGALQVPRRHFSGRTAKELSVMILEQENGLCSHLEHANYLGREFQKAECALLSGAEYIQD